jgi:hypothetical protein
MDCYMMADGQAGVHGKAVLHISANFVMNMPRTLLERIRQRR